MAVAPPLQYPHSLTPEATAQPHTPHCPTSAAVDRSLIHDLEPLVALVPQPQPDHYRLGPTQYPSALYLLLKSTPIPSYPHT